MLPCLSFKSWEVTAKGDLGCAGDPPGSGGAVRSPDTSLTAPHRKPGSCLATTTLPTRSRQGQREGTRVGGHPGDAAGACAWSLPWGTSAQQWGDVRCSQSPGELEHPGQALLSPGNPTNPSPCPGKCTQTSPCAALPACTLCSITGRRAGCIGNCVKHPVMCWNTRRVLLEEK